MLSVAGADGADQPFDVELIGLNGWLEAQLAQRLRRNGADAGDADVFELVAIAGTEQRHEILRRAAAGEGDPVDVAGLERLKKGRRETGDRLGLVDGQVEHLRGAALLQSLAEDGPREISAKEEEPFAGDLGARTEFNRQRFAREPVGDGIA